MAAPSGLEDDDDPLREPRAYNTTIYLFVGMPYLLLGSVGFMIYRSHRARLRAEAEAAGDEPR